MVVSNSFTFATLQQRFNQNWLFIPRQDCTLGATRERQKACAERGQIVNPVTFQCHAVNSEGGCGPGHRLVLHSHSACLAAHCVTNTGAGGAPCTGQVNWLQPGETCS